LPLFFLTKYKDNIQKKMHKKSQNVDIKDLIVSAKDSSSRRGLGSGTDHCGTLQVTAMELDSTPLARNV